MIRLLMLAILLSLPATSWAAVAHVQSKICVVISTAASTMPCTFDGTVTAGNVIVAIEAYAGGTVTAITFTDDQSGSYTTPQSQLSVPAANNGGALGVGTVSNTGTTTVTATYTNSVQPTYHAVCIMELSGAVTPGPIDVSASNQQTAPGTGTDGATSTAAVTTADGDMIVGGVWGTTGLSNTYAVGTGFNSRQNKNSGANLRGLCETLTQTSAGSIAATATSLISASEDTITFMVAIKQALASLPGQRFPFGAVQ